MGGLAFGSLASPPLASALGMALASTLLAALPMMMIMPAAVAIRRPTRPGLVAALRMVPILNARLPMTARLLRVVPSGPSPALLQALLVLTGPRASPWSVPRRAPAAMAAAMAAARTAAISAGALPRSLGTGPP